MKHVRGHQLGSRVERAAKAHGWEGTEHLMEPVCASTLKGRTALPKHRRHFEVERGRE